MITTMKLSERVFKNGSKKYYVNGILSSYNKYQDYEMDIKRHPEQYFFKETRMDNERNITTRVWLDVRENF